MPTKFRIIISISVLIAIAAGVGAWQKTNLPRPDSRVRQIYEARDPYANDTGSQFWIKVTEHGEANGHFVAGAFYFFDSGPAETGPWKNVMTVHLDDPDPIPCDQVRFVNQKVGYLFLYDKLAVTSDAGQSWSTWELAQAHEEWRPKRAIIRDVILNGDGTGTMTVDVFFSPG